LTPIESCRSKKVSILNSVSTGIHGKRIFISETKIKLNKYPGSDHEDAQHVLRSKDVQKKGKLYRPADLDPPDLRPFELLDPDPDRCVKKASGKNFEPGSATLPEEANVP
jgi:hypothetical protein